MVTILYIRVGAGDPPADYQIAQSRAAGVPFDEVLVDEGISSLGSSMKNRPEGKRLFDRLGQDDTLVVRWIDRLGRNYPDMTRTIQNFLDKGVTIRTVIGGVTLHGRPCSSLQRTTTDALVTFLNAAADAQAEVFEEAHKSGLGSVKGGKNVALGRKPSYDRPTLEVALDMLSNGAPIVAVMKTTGLSRSAVSRIKRDPVNARKALSRWEGLSEADD